MLYELNGVTKRYEQARRNVAALNDLDLSIAEGEFLAVQGSTGSGKTTLLQMLGALDRPSSGSVLFDGNDLAVLREGRLCELRSREFGFIFQAFNLIPTLTAQENVETALVPLGTPSAERAARARAALAEVGLAARARHVPVELSGGEQQRVAIARALVRAPRVILADEPTGNLDERTRDEIVALLEELWGGRGQTVIVVTHDTRVAARASRRLWLDAGKVASSDIAGQGWVEQAGANGAAFVATPSAV
jgi:putative ABC transport system ATP-binding protein